ncbi:MAG: PDZ domain-containing protein [Janthinobacterium lividum]
MIGELNASHSGMGSAAPPTGTVAPATGRLGVRFDPSKYEQNGRLRLTTVLPLGAAVLGGLKPGDVLLAVDGRPLRGTTNLEPQRAAAIQGGPPHHAARFF